MVVSGQGLQWQHNLGCKDTGFIFAVNKSPVLFYGIIDSLESMSMIAAFGCDIFVIELPHQLIGGIGYLNV